MIIRAQHHRVPAVFASRIAVKFLEQFDEIVAIFLSIIMQAGTAKSLRPRTVHI